MSRRRTNSSVADLAVVDGKALRQDRSSDFSGSRGSESFKDPSIHSST
jgi:hypothetical protein